jgi:hypothetical protein
MRHAQPMTYHSVWSNRKCDSRQRSLHYKQFFHGPAPGLNSCGGSEEEGKSGRGQVRKRGSLGLTRNRHMGRVGEGTATLPGTAGLRHDTGSGARTKEGNDNSHGHRKRREGKRVDQFVFLESSDNIIGVPYFTLWLSSVFVYKVFLRGTA